MKLRRHKTEAQKESKLVKPSRPSPSPKKAVRPFKKAPSSFLLNHDLMEKKPKLEADENNNPLGLSFLNIENAHLLETSEFTLSPLFDRKVQKAEKKKLDTKQEPKVDFIAAENKEVVSNYLKCLERTREVLHKMADMIQLSEEKADLRRNGDATRQYPIAGLRAGNDCVRDTVETMLELKERIDTIIKNHPNFNKSEMRRVNVLQKDVEKLILEYKEKLKRHFILSESREEEDFMQIDYLEDPSALPFQWEQEGWMDCLMRSSFNRERRRLRRKAEYVEMEWISMSEECVWKKKKAGHTETVKKAEVCHKTNEEMVDAIASVRKDLCGLMQSLENGSSDANQLHLNVMKINSSLRGLQGFKLRANSALFDFHKERRGSRCDHCLDSVNVGVAEIDYNLERIQKTIEKLREEFTVEGLKTIEKVEFTAQNGIGFQLVG